MTARLSAAYGDGARAARRALKLSGAMGADVAVQPRGDEHSHGTARVPYPAQRDGTSAARADMPDWLWDGFTAYDDVAPGRADGTFGQETIG